MFAHVYRLTPALALAGLFILGAGAAEAGIYKWVDEKGVTHYGEKAPEGAKAATVKVTDTTSSDAEDEIRKLGEKRTAGAAEQQKAAARADMQKQKELPADERERTRKLCDQHRKNLETLRSGQRVSTRDEQGNARSLSDEEKANQLKFAEGEVARCEAFEKVAPPAAPAAAP